MIPGHWYILLLVLVIVLIFWGPGKLPEIGSAVGKAMHEFRKQSTDFQEEIRRSAASNPDPQTYRTTDGTPVTPSPAPESKPATPTSNGNPATTPDVNTATTPDVKS